MGPSKCLIACISGPWHFAPIHSARFHDSLSLVLALSPQERTHTSLPHRHSIWFRFPASTSINLPRCCRYRLWSLPPIIHLPPFIHPRHLCQRICDRLCILQFNPVVIHPNNHRFPNPRPQDLLVCTWISPTLHQPIMQFSPTVPQLDP